MEINIGLIIDENKNFMSDFIYNIESKINNYLKGRYYGKDIERYCINLSIIELPLGFERLNKAFKPKYVEYKQVTNPYTKERLEIKKEFIISIKIEGELYKKLVNPKEKESQKIIINEIIKSFSSFDFLPKKVRDFDKERFIIDVKNFLEVKYG